MAITKVRMINGRKSDPELRARGGIGQHAGSVVFAQHDQDARTNQEPQQAQAGKGAATAARRLHPRPVARAVDIFVRDDDRFFSRRRG